MRQPYMSIGLEMRNRAGAFVVIASLLLPISPVAAADRVSEQRSRVKAAQDRLDSLTAQLSRLLGEANSLDQALTSASVSVAITRIRVGAASRKAEESKQIMSERAREAYKRGSLGQIQFLFGVRTFGQFLSFAKNLGVTFEQDAAAYKRLTETAAAIEAGRTSIEDDKRELTVAAQRLEEVREEIQATFEEQQQFLASSKTELAALEAARRKAELAARSSVRSGVSPAVEARRTARQRVLDERLAALLAWITPARLRSTGVVTTGLSSWYGPGFDGRRSSSGATYHQGQMTAASLVLPFGTLLKVDFAGKSVVVVVTDRGPYIPGRVLDLSAGAAQALGLSGVKQVRMEIMTPSEPAPPFP